MPGKSPAGKKARPIAANAEIAVAIVSGGLDSVTLAYLLADEGYRLRLLAFDYGQRHRKELDYARRCAERLDARFDAVDIRSVGGLLSGSALTDDVDVPHGHYAAENMEVTVVPNRNAIMLSIAYGAAVAENATLVGAAMHTGDHYVYPDCRPQFTEAFADMQKKAVEGFGHERLALYTPFIESGKEEIVKAGARLGVPFEETWSCYEGGELHCGLCGTCTERKESFELARVPDPTRYRA